MIIACNPPDWKIRSIIESSKHKAAKWLKDSATGDTWYWAAEEFNHADIAEQFGITDYTKGIAVND